MFDRLFAPALAFMMLFGGTAMVVSGLFPAERAAAPDAASTIAALYAFSDPATGVTLDRVEITARRADALRQIEEEDRLKAQLKTTGTSTAPQAAEGRGVMLQAGRE